MRKWALYILILAFFLAPRGIYATDFSSDNFKIQDPVITLGGEFTTSTNFRLHSSLGQEAIGISVSDTLTLKSGFLYFPAPAVAGTSTPPGPDTSGFYKNFFKIVTAKICDFNSDNLCNIFDLSIFLYWLDKPLDLDAPFDLNSDGRLDIVDVSLIFYYWT